MQIQVFEKVVFLRRPHRAINTHSLIPETGKIKYYVLLLQTESLIEGQRSV